MFMIHQNKWGYLRLKVCLYKYTGVPRLDNFYKSSSFGEDRDILIKFCPGNQRWFGLKNVGEFLRLAVAGARNLFSSIRCVTGDEAEMDGFWRVLVVITRNIFKSF